MKKNFLILVLLSTTISLPVIGAIGAFGELGSNVMVVPNGNPGYRPAFGPMPFPQPIGYVQQIPQQYGYNSQEGFTDQTRRGVHPSIRAANVMLGRWKAIIEQNMNNPAKITEPLDTLEEDATTLGAALRVMKRQGDPRFNEFQILGDLLLLARLRQFTLTLPSVKKGFIQSLKDVLFPKQRNPDLVNNQTGAGQDVDWYQERLTNMSQIISDFTRRITPNFQGGRKPPYLLTGYTKSLEEAERTRDTHAKFVRSLENPGSDEAMAYRKKIENQSRTGQQPQQNYRENYQRSSDRGYDQSEDAMYQGLPLD